MIMGIRLALIQVVYSAIILLDAPFQVQDMPLLGFGKTPLVVAGTVNAEQLAQAPQLGKGEATPQQMSNYNDEVHKLPPDFAGRLQGLVNAKGEKVGISGLGLTLVNGEPVWVVGISSGFSGGHASPELTGQIRSEFAKFSSKQVVVKPEPVYLPGNGNDTRLVQPGEN
jgi:hypothetical protein